MTFDIEQLNLDDTPIEGIEEAFEGWQEAQEFPPPPQPGKKIATIKAIRDMKQTAGVLAVTLDLELRGGDEDGRPLNFVRVSSRMFDRQGVRTSQLLDFVKSSGAPSVPRSNKEFALFLQSAIDRGTLVHFQLDWRAYCSQCADAKLMEATGEVTSDAAKAALTQIQVTEPERARKIRNEVSKTGTKFRNYRSFPEIAGATPYGNGQVPRRDIVECPSCSAELRAQANITRWLKVAATDEATPF